MGENVFFSGLKREESAKMDVYLTFFLCLKSRRHMYYTGNDEREGEPR